MEAAELVERRQEAKRLEEDLVDAHQQRGAAAAPPKGAQCFEESDDKQMLGVRPHLKRQIGAEQRGLLRER